MLLWPRFNFLFFSSVDVATAMKKFTHDTLPPTTTSTSIPESHVTSSKTNRTFQSTMLTGLKVAATQPAPTRPAPFLTTTETALATVTASKIATVTRRATSTTKKTFSSMVWSLSIVYWTRSRGVQTLIPASLKWTSQNLTRRHLRVRAVVAISVSSNQNNIMYSLRTVQALRLAARIAHRSHQATMNLLKWLLFARQAVMIISRRWYKIKKQRNLIQWTC